MASMRKLRRRELRWRRYWARTATSLPRSSWSLRKVSAGRWRSHVAFEGERQRRRDLASARYAVTCYDCGLPDYHRGHGDGIGSCDCPRCQGCGAGPEQCDCWARMDEDLDESCCGSDCDCWGEPGRPVETITVAGGVL
jgi:hypothetical protein